MRNGFTLIELIVVLTIMSIFSGAGYVTYTRSIQSKELDRQVDEFVNVLSLARSKAISRDISPNTLCTTFSGYKVRVWRNTTPPQYKIVFVCSSPSSESVQDPLYQLNNMILLALPSEPYDIPFLYPYGCTNASCAPANIVVTIKNTAISKCKKVTVNNLGNVLVENISCP